MKNTVRITSGTYRGRSISTPGAGTHPMGERERLALFNMISGSIPGASILDAFAGSGALGVEALSRGAASVCFIEKSPAAAKIIRQNLADLGISAPVIVGNAYETNFSEKYDVILLDPPYDKFEPEKLDSFALALSQDGILVLSHPGDAPEIQGLILKTSRKYAGATLSIYAK